MNELVRIIPIAFPFAHGHEAHVDMRARLDIEGGRDWRSPEILRRRRPVRSACRVIDSCGYNFCETCGGNDLQDAPFACAPRRTGRARA